MGESANDIAHYEGCYASVFYSRFAGLGLDVTVEDSTSHGRLDMAVRFNRNVYLFEFKVVEHAGKGGAMARLKAGGYADKYRGPGWPLHLIGVELRFHWGGGNFVYNRHGRDFAEDAGRGPPSPVR